MTSTDTSEIVRAILREQKMTQAEFATYAGVGWRQVSRWARGETAPPARKVAEAIERLGLDPADYGLRPSAVNPALRPPPAAATRDRDEEIAAALFEINAKLDRVLRALQHGR